MVCQNVSSDWFEVWLVVIGTVLGFLLSIVTTLINKYIDPKGKMHLFYKLVYQKETTFKAGVHTNGNETYLTIPLYFEFQNTSNTARVIRDVCLYLFKEGKQVAKMIQIQYSKGTTTKSGEVINETTRNYGGEKNSYSFVLPPLSIQKQECEFVYKVKTSEINEYSFDEIRFSYFNEKNQVMECVFCTTDQGWRDINFNYENEYFELKCSKATRNKKSS